MELHYTQGLEDWLDFQMYNLGFYKGLSRAKLNRRRIIYITLAAAMALLLGFYCNLQVRYGSFFKQHAFLVIFTVLFFAYIIYVTVMLCCSSFYRKFLARAAQKKPRLLQAFCGACSACFEEGLYCEKLDTGFMQKVPCTSIFRIAEARDHLFLYFSEVQVLVVPCSAFSSDEQKKAFLAKFPEAEVI